MYVIYAKLGTGPAERFEVWYKRKQPVVGDRLKVTRYLAEGMPWSEVRVCEIKEIDGKPFYYLEYI